MAQRGGYSINGFMRRNSVSISPFAQPHREDEEDQKFNINGIIAVLSSDDSELEQVESNSRKEPIKNSNAERSKVDTLPRIQSVCSEVGSKNVQEQHSVPQPSSNLHYDELLKTVSALAETVKSMKNNFENFENKRNSKRKYKKKSRKNYSSDSTSSDSSSSSSESTERRRKKRRHRYKSPRSYRKRYTDSSSEFSSDRERRRYHRHCYHCCRYDEKITKPNQNRINIPLNSKPMEDQNNVLQVNETLHYKNQQSRNRNESQSLQTEPSTSHQNEMQARRRNTIRQSRCERPIIDSDSSGDNFSSENSHSPNKNKRKPVLRPKEIAAIKRRNSVAANSVAAQDIFRPPNINKNLYFANKIANKCQICNKSIPNRMVSHYKKCHENSEVYVSRISEKMVQKAENGLHQAKKWKKKVDAFCFFCEEKKEFDANYWIDHYRSHTGEYAYRCISCKAPTSHKNPQCCRRGATKIFNDDFYKRDFIVYICEICNFIQINEASVRKHLRVEHEDAEDSQYHKLALLPSLYNLSKRSTYAD